MSTVRLRIGIGPCAICEETHGGNGQDKLILTLVLGTREVISFCAVHIRELDAEIHSVFGITNT